MGIFKDADEANSVLRSKRGLSDYDYYDTTDAKTAKELQNEKINTLIDQCHLTSVESWGELKETMEAKKRSQVPEEKVDELETCVSRCKRREKWLKFGPGDKSIEEKKQNQEEAYEKSCNKGKCDESVFNEKLIPCPKCFRYIPDVDEGLIPEIDVTSIFKKLLADKLLDQ